MVPKSFRIFGGVKPKIDARLLPDYLAQIASNCRLTSGALSPWRKFTTINTPTKAGTKISIYRIPYGGLDYWLSWTTDVDVVKSQIANDAFNRYYYTGDGEPRATTDQMATQGGGSNYPLAFYTLGLPAPTTPTMGTIVGGAASNQTRAYVYTLVSAWGEEGPPSLPVSATGKADATWTVNLPQVAQPGGGTFNAATKNIYRTVTNSDGSSSFYFVASVALATASYADAALDVALVGGTILPSTGWVMPPSGMSGLIALPNGSMAGFVNNQLCLSEPYQPHAWPLKYRYSVDFPIVGIKANGSSIAVCTTANPYVFSGLANDALGSVKARVPEPCLSKRSMVDVGWGVVYASPNGLANAMSYDAQIVTADSIMATDWRDLYFPSTMFGAVYQGFYHGYYQTGIISGAGLIIDRSSDFGFKQITDFATGAWLDPQTGFLYLIVNGSIVKWDSDVNNNMSFDWKSKVFIEIQPGNYGVIQVLADYASLTSAAQAQAQLVLDRAFNATMLAAHKDHGELGTFVLGEIPLGGSLLHGSGIVLVNRFVQVRLFASGVLKYTFNFTDKKTHKLPSGFRDDTYEVEITGNVTVYNLKLAENAKALRFA